MLYLILLFKYCFFEHWRKLWNSKRNSGQHEIPWAEKKVWEVREKQKKKQKTKEMRLFKFLLNVYNKKCDLFSGKKSLKFIPQTIFPEIKLLEFTTQIFVSW